MTGRRPRRLIASATAPGKLPPPQMIASGSPAPAAAASAFGVSDTIGVAVLGGARGGRMHQRPLAAAANESDDLLCQWIVDKFDRRLLDSFGKHPFTQEQHAIGEPQPPQIGARSAAPAQTNNIEANELRNLSQGETERNDVRRHAA